MAADKKGIRKPVHLELIGGKTARQRVWEAIRRQTVAFTCYQIARQAEADDETVLTYLRALTLAGFVEVVEAVQEIGDVQTYRLARDNGVEAPRLTARGKPVQQGRKTEALWRAMRVLSQKGDFCPRDLLAVASTAAEPISFETAKSYVLHLVRAGYLRVTQPARRVGIGQGRLSARYRLLPARNTGPRPPMIQRTKAIFDPNLNAVVWSEQEEATHEPA